MTAPSSLDPQRQELAKEYARIQRRLSFVEMGIFVLILALFLVTGLSSALRDWAIVQFGGPYFVTVAIYGLVLGATFFLISLPLDFYSGYTLPTRYGLNTQSVAGWVSDSVKSLVLTA